MKISFENIDTIIWDWNGTLLNDLSHCIECMNILLEKRGLQQLVQEKYLEIFTFPVRDYYQSLGFDFTKERFEIPAEEFIVHYQQGLKNVKLHDDATEALDFFYKKSCRQYIVSAMHHESLKESVNDQQVSSYFNGIFGINDNLAHGKTTLASKLMSEEGIDPQKTVLIGDTLHDAEVAGKIGVKSILVSNGHQHHLKLSVSKNPVFPSLRDLIKKI